MGAALVVLLALGSGSSAGTADGELLRVTSEGAPVPFLRWTGPGPGSSEVVLGWADGRAVELRKNGSFWVCPIPRDLVPGAGEQESLTVQLEGRELRLAPDQLTVAQAEDGRWTLLGDDLLTPVAPPAPLTIRVPAAEEPAPEPEPQPEDAQSGRPPSLESLTSFLKLASRAGGLGARIDPALSDGERALLDDQELENVLLERLLEREHGLRFLEDVNFRFRTFDHDGESSLGASYSYEKSRPFRVRDHADGEGITGSSLELSFEGNIAFEDEVNPADFLASRVSLDRFRSRGGSRGPLDPAAQQRAVDLATAASRYDDRDEWLASDAWQELKGLARGLFTTQVYWEVGLDATYESDQSFDAQNLAYGAHVALDVKAWNDGSELATLNLVDYPAALVRYLTGFDEELTPRGSSLPTLVLALERVDPGGDTPRADVGDTSDYSRARGELVYKAPLGLIGGEQYSLTALARGYLELDPSDAVDDAGLDRIGYVTLAIETETGLFASFSSGQLPFDDEDAEVYALGWSFHF